MAANVSVTVVGGRATLAELRKLDRKLYFQTIGRIKREAKPLAAAVDDGFPSSSPTRGMDHKGRTGWGNRRNWKAAVKVGGRRTENVWPLVRVLVNSPPKAIADMAGSGQLSTALGGSPSRYVWPAARRMMPGVTRAVESAIRDASRLANTRLRRVR